MLRIAGVRTILVRERMAPGEKLVFVFNALHRIDDIDQAANILAAAIDARFARRQLQVKRQKDWLWAGQGHPATGARSP